MKHIKKFNESISDEFNNHYYELFNDVMDSEITVQMRIGKIYQSCNILVELSTGEFYEFDNHEGKLDVYSNLDDLKRSTGLGEEELSDMHKVDDKQLLEVLNNRLGGIKNAWLQEI